MKELFRAQEIGATPQELADLQAVLGYALPCDYLIFLAETNGAEWGIHDRGGDCLALWQVSEIVSMNHESQIQRWMPRVLAIGSDGGGDAIVFNQEASPEPNSRSIVRVGFGTLDKDGMTLLADSFVAWGGNEFRLRHSD
jgi:hypothetical protein